MQIAIVSHCENVATMYDGQNVGTNILKSFALIVGVSIVSSVHWATTQTSAMQ